MAKTKQQKQESLKDLTERIKNSKSLVFVNFSGLKVKEIEELRKKCRDENIDYLVAKKRLMKIAFKDAGIDVDPTTFENAVAIAFGREDEVAPAKVVQDFAKEHEALQAIGGIFESKFANKEQIIALALLPSRQELLARVVGSIKAPVSGFVNVLAGNLRSFVYVLNAIKDIK